MILNFLLKTERIPPSQSRRGFCQTFRVGVSTRDGLAGGGRLLPLPKPVSSHHQQMARWRPSSHRGERNGVDIGPKRFSDRICRTGHSQGHGLFQDKLGVPEFLFIEKPELQDETYLGKPAPLRLHLAFGWCGDTQVELIQPIAGTSTYSKFLDHNPQGGMHHYGIEVPDYGKGVREMEASGFALVQGGRHNETRFAYFDTTGTIGALTEIVYLQPEEKAFMHSLKHKK